MTGYKNIFYSRSHVQRNAVLLILWMIMTSLTFLLTVDVILIAFIVS